MEVVVGGAAVSQRFLQLQLGAEREVMAFVTDNPVAVSGPENEAEGVAVARGVTYRIVIERALLTSPEEFAEVSASLGRDVNIRVVDRVPTKLVVADGSLAMVPLSGTGSEPAALVIHASGLLESLSGLFESVWREATPLVLVGPGSETMVEAQTAPTRTTSRCCRCSSPGSRMRASPSSSTWGCERSSDGCRGSCSSPG